MNRQEIDQIQKDHAAAKEVRIRAEKDVEARRADAVRSKEFLAEHFQTTPEAAQKELLRLDGEIQTIRADLTNRLEQLKTL